MEPPEFMMGLVTVLSIFVGLPWLVLHYVTKWKQAPKITPEDENLLDEMYNLARRLEDRVQTVERIVAADNPNWRPGLGAAPSWQPGLSAPQQGWTQPAPAQPSTYSVDRRN